MYFFFFFWRTNKMETDQNNWTLISYLSRLKGGLLLVQPTTVPPHSPSPTVFPSPPPAYESKMNYSAIGRLLLLICITTV